MSDSEEITQRDLRVRSREIMDAVESGQSYTVTRSGRQIGMLIPLRHRRRFVPRAEFASISAGTPSFELDSFRQDQAAAVDYGIVDPYE